MRDYTLKADAWAKVLAKIRAARDARAPKVLKLDDVRKAFIGSRLKDPPTWMLLDAARAVGLTLADDPVRPRKDSQDF